CGSAGLPPPVGGDPPQAASSTTPRALSGSRVRIVPIMYTRLRSAGFLVLARRGSAAQAATRRVPLKRQCTRQFTDKRRAAGLPAHHAARQPLKRTGHANTSARPPVALARNAGAAPYRWNTPPSATPPTSAANPVRPWYVPNPLPCCVPASRATSARSGLSVSPETRPSARNSPHAAAAVPARAIPTASIAYPRHPP